MAQTGRRTCGRNGVDGMSTLREELLQAQREEFLLARREALEDTDMRRYSHPIPTGGTERVITYAAPETWDDGAVLEALERQNNLMAELLAAVTGLTAACLCRKKD